jgi:CheY-like chemotaxis protein
MGLSVVQGIVRGHKGTIQVTSEPERGSTFRIFFPTRVEAEVGPLPRYDPRDQGWRGSGKVLIIDDERLVLKVGKRMLERLGFTPVIAGNGRDGILAFREIAPEVRVVLLDMTMPDMNGVEAFHELHRIDPLVPVILCSGYSEQEATRRFGEHDLAGFIQKPFEMGTLIHKLRSLLEK